MAVPRRRDIISNIRRRQDDSEGESSEPGALEDDSLTEGSAISNGEDEVDIEGSELSVEDNASHKNADEVESLSTTNRVASQAVIEPTAEQVTSNGNFKPVLETQPVVNGLKNTETGNVQQEIPLDDVAQLSDVQPSKTDVTIPKGPRNETPAQRSRREHQEYVRQRNTNPAFVPNRGGFFLHDDRTNVSTFPETRSFARGRGRGFNPGFQAGRGIPVQEPTESQWAHDLHDKHENTSKDKLNPSFSNPGTMAEQPKTSSTPAAPNRSFSVSTVLGNVTVQIYLPGMADKITVGTVKKKQHTLLPQHRPPLRRDKPVRISIPDQAPRYIFPSTDRSFIFIPRALRPNQQSYRGRGRGSFHGSRRPSVYGGSTYTPSVAMSRKSSIGGMRDNLRSPAGSTYSRSMGMGGEATRPIVRMPTGDFTIPGYGAPLPVNGHNNLTRDVERGPGSIPNAPVSHGVHSTAIPMYQPKPQKAVSVADIESPASFNFRPPQPQQEQPFHQQMPAHVTAALEDSSVRGSQPTTTLPGGTPLSHIPEAAVYANTFQPYNFVPGSAYYGTPYANGGVFYPTMGEGTNTAMPMTGPAMAPNFIPGSHGHQVAYGHPVGLPADALSAANAMAHETNGMVYYYDPNQYSGNVPNGMSNYNMTSNGAVMNMGTMMPPQSQYYYSSVPNGMFYAGQSG